MKVTFYIGLGTQAHEIWSGNLDVLPRVGEQIVLDAGATGYVVAYIHHWLPIGKSKQSVKVYVR